jgi:hypothetical protein
LIRLSSEYEIRQRREAAQLHRGDATVDGKVVEYLIYAPISLLLTVWVATTLFRHGTMRRRSRQPERPPAAPPPGWQPQPR